MIPCDWCEREDQLTCPECNGTGFVDQTSDDDEWIEIQEQYINNTEQS